MRKKYARCTTKVSLRRCIGIILPIILIQLILVLIPSAEAKDADDYEYLIVTTEALKNGWNDFVEFNKRRCLRTKLQTIDYIKANIQGVDDADKLRNYIKQEFTDHNIVYVLLGGDDIPVREFRAEFYDNIYSPDNFYDIKEIAADMYYSCLDGDWKEANQYYGEPGTEDMYCEVYVSRLPVDNITDLDNIVNKVIQYSENPVEDQITNNLLAADLNVDRYLEEFMGTCNANGYTTIGFPPSEWATTRLYDKNGDWTIDQFRDTVNSLKPTWIDFMGHGTASLVFNETNAGVTNDNYQNNGTNANYFIIYTPSAYSGKFTESDCILEEFINLQNGAIACIGCSEMGMGDLDSTDSPVQRVQRYFHDALFNKKIHYLEMMNAYSKEINTDIIVNSDIQTPPYYGSMRFAVYQVNVLGDPALSVWTDTPKELTQPFEWAATPDKFTMKTPPFTWVALADISSGEIFTTQLTGFNAAADNSFVPEDSICEITDDDYKDYVAINHFAKVYIKAHNYLAKSFDIQFNPGIINFNEKVIKQYSVKSIKGKILIYFTLLSKEIVTISVYNSKGTLANTMVNKYQNSGKYSVAFKSDDFCNGIYYIKLSTGNNTLVRKAVVIK